MSPLPEIANWQDIDCSKCSELDGWSGACKVVRASPCPIGGLLAVGEAPGSTETDRGVGFVGDAGKKLRTLLRAHSLSDDDFGCANVCRCQPEKNRRPRAPEIRACVPFLASLIRELRPKVILAVGGRTAVNVLCGRGPLYRQIDIGRATNTWRARPDAAIELSDALRYGPYVIPMPHTSPLAMNRKAPGGKNWSEIANEQVAIALKLFRAK